MVKPTIPPEPTPPELASQLGPVIVITAQDAAYYAEACEAWGEREEDGSPTYSDEEMATLYPSLSRSAACDWAIYGYTVQDNLNLENIFILQADYAERMRAYTEYLRETIERMYNLSEEVREEATKPIPEPKRWYQFQAVQ